MLTFVPLLWIAVSGADAASQQTLSQESNVRLLPRPKSGAITRRLNIFESFARSADQQGDALQLSADVVKPDQDSLDSDDEKSVNEILQHSLVELKEIIDAAKTHLISTESVESLIVFQSLLKMLSIPEQFVSDSPSSWQRYRYLSESIRNLKCSVTDLCREFDSNFKCDQQGHLIWIRLEGMRPFHHLNLLMIPNTVEALKIERCGLTSISAWADLKGKSLKTLRIYESKAGCLKLNLDGLQGTLDHLPLEQLSVGTEQVREYFGLRTLSPSDSAMPQIEKWMKASTLVNLKIAPRHSRHNRGGTRVIFGRDSIIFLSRNGTPL